MPAFWQEPKTVWWKVTSWIAGIAAYNFLRYKHWDWAADLLGFVYVILLLLAVRSFLPYSMRRVVGENDNE